ncbi:ATP-dependent DNA helicase pif1 [Fusarium oxysporum f. sp. raphani]|uniref:ATP-dependent DNA helicase n=1 Tax=Fusarium oxysporum f. sp. raphani TaxID=96318 RepID=A0A8J5U5N0_FUSOX|nr:ATP-dependent DNA helicase pif1 [Fusarium oxysporum f. sp. raphani]
MNPPSLCTQCRQPWSLGVSGAYRTCLECREKTAARRRRLRAAPAQPAPPMPIPVYSGLDVAAATNRGTRPCIGCAIDAVDTPTLLVASAASPRRVNLQSLAHRAVRGLYAQNARDHGSQHCAVLAELPVVCEPRLRLTRRWGHRHHHQTVFVLAVLGPGLQRSIVSGGGAAPDQLRFTKSLQNLHPPAPSPLPIAPPGGGGGGGEGQDHLSGSQDRALSRREDSNWWVHLARLRVRPFQQTWTGRCAFCDALLLSTEKGGWCCSNGKRTAPKLPPYPPDFQRWLDTTALPLSAFSRRLNYLFAFSALGVTEGFVHFGVPSDVVVAGRVYHRLLNLSSGDHSMRWFLYDEAARSDKALVTKVPLTAVHQVRRLLQSVNPYLSSIRHALQQVPSEATPLAVELRDSPASGEIAAIINTQKLNTVDCRKVVFFRHGGRAQFVHVLSRHYEPLQYPLFFPHGTPGWGVPGLGDASLREGDATVTETGARMRMPETCGLSQLQWCRSMLLAEPRFLISGRLTCEYLVDMYSRIEEMNLDYLRRARSLQSSGFDPATDSLAYDHLRNRLPANFTGSRAWTSDHVPDALALARRFGKPTFFITMTTNPGWPDIVSALRSGQHFTDAPTVACSAFHMRLQHLKAVIKHHFGRLIYAITVVEFQKRGLPHAHMLIKVSPEPTIDALDAIISAELPRSPADAALRASVLRTNIHSRNHLNGPSYCNRDGRCRFGFPHPLSRRTTFDPQGRIHFRRREEEDAWVVPYMPSLILYMDCHINVDVCLSVNIFIDDSPASDTPDEYKDYIAARYLSSSEAAYRIFSFSIVTKEPSVRCLPVHLENHQLGQMWRASGNQSFMSDLLWYFQRPRRPPFDNPEFYARFYYDSWQLGRALRDNHIFMFLTHSDRGPRQRVLIERRHGEVITRIHAIPPRVGELFYLRILLQNRPAYSFIDLRTIDGTVYSSYQETAVALGLFRDVCEAQYALEEAVSSFALPPQLRFLFAHLLLDSPHGEAISRTLQSISRILRGNGATMRQFGLPEPTGVQRELQLELAAFARQRETLMMRSRQNYAALNAEQRHIFDVLHSSLATGGCFFVDGRAGRGKTFLMGTLCDYIRTEGEVVCVAGSTALSVTLYDRGRTAHSTFGIPVRESSCEIVSQLSPHSGRAELLRHAALLLWEELPMANKTAVQCADQLLRSIVGRDQPFGGKTFIGIGDFRQVAPVTPATTAPEAVFNASIRSSHLWPHFRILHLIAPLRNAANPFYSAWLDKISDRVTPLDTVVDLRHLHLVYSIGDAVDFLFPAAVLDEPAQSVRRSFLSPFNLRVDEFNRTMLDRLRGDEVVLLSSNRIKEMETRTNALPSALEFDYLALLDEPGVPPHRLCLKPNAICSIMRNLDIAKGLVQNSRVRVVRIGRHVVDIQLLRAAAAELDGHDCFSLPRITFEFQPRRIDWTLQRRQIPLRLAYATTFNSCQGLTLDRVVLDLRDSVFAHGQLYTSLSRVRQQSDLRVLLAEHDELTDTMNVVHYQLLLPL